jgi:hypothetical protein
VPFTRAALNDKKIHNETVLNKCRWRAGREYADTKSKYYLEELRILNHQTCCDILNVAGRDDELLHINSFQGLISHRQAATQYDKAQTKERQM